MRYLIALLAAFSLSLVSLLATAESIEKRLLKSITRAHAVDERGAMGRNRRDYIHARFQYRAHLHAQLAVVGKEIESLDRFVRALEYAAFRQSPDGSYPLQIPRYLAGHRASTGDLASGTAFFWRLPEPAY